MPQRLPISLTQVKKGNISGNFWNMIRNPTNHIFFIPNKKKVLKKSTAI